MRLLKYGGHGKLGRPVNFTQDVPRYAILSHTWGADADEVTFNDLQNGSGKSKAGYAKIQFCGEQAKKDDLQYIWVDTCCIDKANHTELSEAIASMFRWYRDAEKCYVYLQDVSARKRDNENETRRMWESTFRMSRWFTRGWTLQELIAPKSVEFFSREGELLGDKKMLEQQIHEITQIPTTALHGAPLSQFSVDQRLRWAATRHTQKKEDKAYCLLGIFDIFMPLIYGEGDNAFVRLKEEIDRPLRKLLDKLPCAKGALFDSYGDDHTTCHPATRIDLLHQIRDWAEQPHTKNIFWLSGAAGAGKSTISRTFAESLSRQGQVEGVSLGASFFFKRGEGDRGTALRFFPTITRELILKIPGLEILVAEVIASDPFIFDKSLGEQFNKLIYQPLQQINVVTSIFSALVVVVDALDECEKESDIKAILALWSRLAQVTTIRLRLFLTSRPDLPIQLGFKRMSTDTHHDMVLHDEVPRTTIHYDILTFMKDEFSKIREDYNSDRPSSTSLEHDWPGSKALQALTDMAVPLFIVAATVCRSVGDSNWDPRKRLETILASPGIGVMTQMELTYLPVLQQLLVASDGLSDTELLYREFRMIVGSIVTLAEPLSSMSLANLLNISPDIIWLRLRPLHSVLRVPADLETPIRTLHLSFGEFLLSDRLRHQPFGVDGPGTHRTLLIKCLEFLSGPDGLRENMCDLEYPGQPRRELDSTTINRHLAPAVQYACRYWVHHIQYSEVQIHDEDEVHTFLRKHFLHWLEALSLMNRIAEVVQHIHILQSLVSANTSTQLSSFLEDARRVILANRYITDSTPLQIYSSAMVFAPQTSVVRKICGKAPIWLRKYPTTPITWSPELQKLEGHTGPVSAVAFSPDGSLLASASYDQTVRLWNPTTGQEVQKLEGHTDLVIAVAFSPDGSLLASASDDRTVRLWNPTTGQEVQKLEGHTGFVTAVAFSPDGSLLASASEDQTVRLWNPTTGQEVQKLEYVSGITTVNLTSDNMMLLTNRGAMYIRNGSITTPALESLNNKTSAIKDNWIQINGRNFLWLPQDYRGSCSAFYGHMFAIGQHSGQVSLFQIDNT